MTDPMNLPSRRAFVATALVSPWLAKAARHPGVESPTGTFRADADLLARAYGALHPGLYRYNTAAQMAARFEALRSHLSEPRTLAEAYLAFARVTAAVRCGHSHPNFYNQSKAIVATLFSGKDRLPLHFRWIGDRMVVTRDLSPNGRLAAGTEIVSVNGLPASQLLQALLPLARADGSNDAKRRRQMELAGIDRWEAFDLYLPMLFPQTVARSEVRLAVAGPDGARREVTVALMTAAERAAAAPSPLAKPPEAPLWSLTRQPGAVSVLSMPTWTVFHGSWDWRAWLDHALDEVASDGTRGLVVDLRGNEGGLDCGNPILSRLVDNDLVVQGQGRRVRYRKLPDDLAPHVDTWDDSFRDWGEQAVGPRPDGFYELTRFSDDASGHTLIRPSGKRFKGRLVVLVDAANSSATFQFAQIVKDAGLGQLVGAPTGGNRRGINGGAFLFLRLPASGIEVDIPLIGYFPPTPQPDAGIEPDVPVSDSVEDIASGVDRAMAAARNFGAQAR
jgi:hypothetical protein